MKWHFLLPLAVTDVAARGVTQQGLRAPTTLSLHPLLQKNSTGPFLASAAKNSMHMHGLEPLLLQEEIPFLWTKIAIFGAFVGGIFGIMGAGASMIMKPLLYYAFDQWPFKRTIFEMYLILVILASVGTLLGHLKGNVAWDHVAVVAVCASGLGTAAGAMLATAVSSRVQLVFFGFLVLGVAAHMWRQARASTSPSCGELVAEECSSRWRVAWTMDTGEFMVVCASSAGVGILSGFVGVGGGFMLTPLLCHLGHKMDTAVPTSLAVIALSGGTGALWYAHLFGLSLASVNVVLVLSLSAAGCVGLLFSQRLASLVSKAVRQQAFACLLVIIGSIVILLELLMPMQRAHSAD